MEGRKKKLVVLTGAGMSAESGIKTFRDANGLWEGHDVMEVASPQGWYRNPELVLEFYNQRRQQLTEVVPNAGHKALADLEQHFEVSIVTQNVDDLHERAGSSNVLHLHGELLKSQSSIDPNLVYDCRGDIHLGDFCPLGSQLRPFIVWFGEEVPMLEQAIAQVMQSDVLLIVGTSMTVYPAAGLVSFIKDKVPVYYVDPKPSITSSFDECHQLTVIESTAAQELPALVEQLARDY